MAGAATSLLLYAVEYLPSHLSLRLEVNHPLYALSWLAGGELLSRMLGLRFGIRAWSRREFGVDLALASLVAVLPVVFLLGGEQVHAMRDAEVFRLHEFVNESQPYFAFFKVPWVFFANFLLLPFFLPLAAGLVFFARRLDGFGRWMLWIGFVAALGALVLTGLERRWVCYFAQYGVVLMAIVLSIGAGWLELPARRIAVAIAIVVLGAGPVFLFRQQLAKIAELRAGETIDRQVMQRILMKRYAVQMAAVLRGREVRLLAEPSLAPSLFYFGGLRSTVTFYWENRAGVQAAADFFDAADDGTARCVAAERGLTHVLMPANGRVPAVFHYIHTGQPLPPGGSNFAERLVRGRARPGWIAPDPSLANLDACFFGAFRLGNPVLAWKISLPPPHNP